MDTSKRPLTIKQQQFALEYCIDFNGKQAAIRAGYKSDRAADAAYKLLKDIRVRTAISNAMQCRVNALEFRINQIGAKEQAKAICSIADFFEIDEDGTFRFKNLMEYKDNLLDDVDELKISGDGVVLGVKLKNPTRSLQQMMNIARFLKTNDYLSL